MGDSTQTMTTGTTTTPANPFAVPSFELTKNEIEEQSKVESKPKAKKEIASGENKSEKQKSKTTKAKTEESKVKTEKSKSKQPKSEIATSTEKAKTNENAVNSANGEAKTEKATGVKRKRSTTKSTMPARKKSRTSSNSPTRNSSIIASPVKKRTVLTFVNVDRSRKMSNSLNVSSIENSKGLTEPKNLTRYYEEKKNLEFRFPIIEKRNLFKSKNIFNINNNINNNNVNNNNGDISYFINNLSLKKLDKNITFSTAPTYITVKTITICGKEKGKIAGKRREKVEWEQIVSGKPISIAGNQKFCAIGCHNGDLHFFTPSGQRYNVSIRLEGGVELLVVNDNYLMAITNGDYYLYIFEISNFSLLHRLSISQFLSSSVFIDNAILTKKGEPMILTSDGEFFTYHEKMNIWTQIAAVNNYQQSCYHHSLPTLSKGILSEIENQIISLRKCDFTPPFRTTPNFDSLISISHLSNLVACSKTLRSKNEYKKWILIFVRHLTLINDLKILKEICDDFISHFDNDNIIIDNSADRMEEDRDENDEFLTQTERRQIFQQILQIIQTNQNANNLLENYKSYENL